MFYHAVMARHEEHLMFALLTPNRWRVTILYMTNFSTEAHDIAATVSLILSESLADIAPNDIWAPSYRNACQDIQDHYRRTSTTAGGAYRHALIFSDFVVKYSLSARRQQALLDEASFIREMRNDEKYARHFPETVVVQVGEVPVLLQERVKMRPVRDWDIHNEVERLADVLGIHDMHEENYGWAGPKGKEYPVFIDVDLRGNRTNRKRRSWFV